jgi:hypothetical protein
MSDEKLNRLTAIGVFLIAAVVYFKTLSTTVVFWDVGEFIASAVLLQVPHPPGSPLFILLGRIVSIIPFMADTAARVHSISAVGSALTISFLYLIAVKMVLRVRGEMKTGFDRVVVFGSSAVGALTLAFTTTFWDNAIEAEVYGLSMLFVALILWLALRWYERADEPHSEKYLLLIAYLVGLSVGVHLLAVLAIFFVLTIYYFRMYEVNRTTAIQFGLIGLAVFFVIYPGIVQMLPSMLDGEFKGIKSDFVKFIPIALIIAAAYGVFRTIQTKQKFLHIACLSFLLIVAGYTTYTAVLIRSNVPNLPMNENAPKDLAKLTSYLGREQYGDTPMFQGPSWDNELQNYREKYFPRRWSQESMHEPTRTNYTSDGDFLWRYQINHMYIRYVLWNFVGADGDEQDAGVSWKDTWGIPLIIGLIGLYYHFQKDWKMALNFLGLFMIMGVVLALYQNQQEPQPRERDYFYVGAYFIMAMWIAVGLAGIIDMMKKYLKQDGAFAAAGSGVLVLGMLAIPANLLRINYFEHDRSGNYIAWDYSYNLLQSCPQDAILFTNGDNDTFPVWYLQDVEGVRRDVRVVNLSLVNTSWYIDQLKNQMPHGTKKVPISLSDQQIERISPVLWKPRDLELPVPKSVLDRFTSSDVPKASGVSLLDSNVVNKGKIIYTLSGVQINQDTRILRVQDIMVRDIITANAWERPICFAVTVSPDSKIGLDNYLWMEGQTYELKPFRNTGTEGGLDEKLMEANFLARNVVPSKTPQPGFLYRNLNNPHVYYDENTSRMVMNYRAGFIRLAENANRIHGDREKAKKIMAQMEETVPLNVVPMQDWRYLVYLMRVYRDLGDSVNYTNYGKKVEAKANELTAAATADPQSLIEPYQVLLELYDMRKEYGQAVGILNKIAEIYPNDPEVNRRLQMYKALMSQSGADTTRK